MKVLAVGFLFFCLLISVKADAQVLVDSKNLNDDLAIQYVQLIYFIDQKTFKPVYFIDFGIADKQQEPPRDQKISINNKAVVDTMSPVMLLNLMYAAGWEYLGDYSYEQIPMMENLHFYTLRRKDTGVPTASVD